MKKLMLCTLLLLFYTSEASSDLFTDLLEVKEPKPNKLYYQLLPQISHDDPDFYFLKINNNAVFEKAKKRVTKKNIAVGN